MSGRSWISSSCRLKLSARCCCASTPPASRYNGWRWSMGRRRRQPHRWRTARGGCGCCGALRRTTSRTTSKGWKAPPQSKSAAVSRTRSRSWSTRKSSLNSASRSTPYPIGSALKTSTSPVVVLRKAPSDSWSAPSTNSRAWTRSPTRSSPRPADAPSICAISPASPAASRSARRSHASTDVNPWSWRSTKKATPTRCRWRIASLSASKCWVSGCPPTRNWSPSTTSPPLSARPSARSVPRPCSAGCLPCSCSMRSCVTLAPHSSSVWRSRSRSSAPSS